MSLADDPRSTIGSDPIPGDVPAGVSVRYEPIYESLEAMISKMESGGPNAVPWDKLAPIAIEILRDHSKDILVGAYATFALYRNEGFAGLAIGLKIVRDMVETYWEDLQPPKKRERARVSAIEWIAERLGPLMEGMELTPEDGAAVMAAFTALTELDELLGAKLETQTVALGALTRPLRDLNRTAEAAAEAAAAAAAAAPPETPPAEAAPNGAPGDTGGAAVPPPAATSAPTSAPAGANQPATTPTAAPPAPAAPAVASAPAAPPRVPTVAAATFNSADLGKSITDMQHSLRSFAEALRAGNPADPRAYWLLRTATWLPVTQMPPVENGKTALPEMASDTVIAVENRLKAGDLPAVLTAAESNFANAPYWLAAHRFSAAALAQLGDDYADARAVVIGQLAAFLRRFPEVPHLQFSSGAPFADEATAAWIKDEVLSGGDAAGGDDSRGDVGAWDAAITLARQAASKGKINDAFGIFKKGRASASGRRARFLWDLRQAEFCFEHGDVVPAARLLETLDDEYQELGLAEWEPDIGLQVAELLLKCYAKAGDRLGAGEGAAAARVAKLQAVLCRLDMSKAVSLMKP